MPNKNSSVIVTTTVGKSNSKLESDFYSPILITWTPQPKENKKYDLRELVYHSQDLAELGSYDEAIETAKAILDKDYREYTLCTIASTMLEINNYDRALTVLENVDTNINYYESFLSKTRTLIELADKYIELNVLTNLNNVLLSVESLINEFSDDDIHKSEFFNELAFLYAHIGDKEKAMFLWDKYLFIVLDRIRKHESHYDEIQEFTNVILKIAETGEYEKAKALIFDIPSNNLRKSVSEILKNV